MKLNKILNTNSLPLNLNLLKAKAANIVVNVLMVTLIKVTMIEFLKYVKNEAALKASTKFEKFSQLLGHHFGGYE